MKKTSIKHKTGFVPVGKILPVKSKEYKLDSALVRYKALKFWQTAAADFLENSGELTRALEFKNGVLVVACLSQELAYQIKVLSGRIIYVLNGLLGKNLVFAIRVET